MRGLSGLQLGAQVAVRAVGFAALARLAVIPRDKLVTRSRGAGRDGKGGIIEGERGVLRGQTYRNLSCV